MKIRTGFVSNSSSSSFLLDISTAKWNKDVANLKDRILAMHDCSDELSRHTGRISDIKGWLELSLDGDLPCYEYEKILPILLESYSYRDLIIIRESDEDMGGVFEEYGITYEDIYPYVIYKFEYH